jgi:hypothetical protein
MNFYLCYSRLGFVHVPDEVKTCIELKPLENPVAVPLFANVTPLGIVNVSPESPNVNAVPERGLILLVLTSLI